MHVNALKRDAHEISKFSIFSDRHHWKNHVGCSLSYNCDKYHYLKNVNSQICEQKNRSLRKLFGLVQIEVQGQGPGLCIRLEARLIYCI